LKNNVNINIFSKSKKQNNCVKKICFGWHLEG